MWCGYISVVEKGCGRNNYESSPPSTPPSSGSKQSELGGASDNRFGIETSKSVLKCVPQISCLCKVCRVTASSTEREPCSSGLLPHSCSSARSSCFARQCFMGTQPTPAFMTRLARRNRQP